MTSDSDKKLYREFAATEVDTPIFLKPWWLDLVCQTGEWEAALVRDKNNTLAIMPFFNNKKWNVPIITMPPLTPFLGPWIVYPNDLKLSSRYDYEERLITALLQQLPPKSYIRYKSYYDLKNFLPFHWQNFRTTVRTSYVLQLDDMAVVKAGCNRNIRRNIRSGEANLVCVHDLSVAQFYEVLSKSYQRQKKKMPYSFSLFEQLDEAIKDHRAGVKLATKDDNGNVHSVAYLLWDNKRSYYWLAGDDPTYRSSGSGIWVCWQAMQFVAANRDSKTFDFAGSMIRPIEKMRRQFGATQAHFYQFEKFGRGPLGILAKLRTL